MPDCLQLSLSGFEVAGAPGAREFHCLKHLRSDFNTRSSRLPRTTSLAPSPPSTCKLEVWCSLQSLARLEHGPRMRMRLTGPMPTEKPRQNATTVLTGTRFATACPAVEHPQRCCAAGCQSRSLFLDPGLSCYSINLKFSAGIQNRADLA